MRTVSAPVTPDATGSTPADETTRTRATVPVTCHRSYCVPLVLDSSPSAPSRRWTRTGSIDGQEHVADVEPGERLGRVPRVAVVRRDQGRHRHIERVRGGSACGLPADQDRVAVPEQRIRQRSAVLAQHQGPALARPCRRRFDERWQHLVADRAHRAFDAEHQPASGGEQRRRDRHDEASLGGEPAHAAPAPRALARPGPAKASPGTDRNASAITSTTGVAAIGGRRLSRLAMPGQALTVL